MKLFKDILKQIKKYDTIVIARHIGADPDALGSQFALKELILGNFKDKKIYAVGTIAQRFRFMGNLDKIDGVDLSKALLIVLDTPDKKRIEGIDDVSAFDYVIKIDHHPYVESYANIEYIEDNASSASQLVFKFAIDNKLKISSKVAENIYIGIVGDTDRFLHDYTSNETFSLVSKLLDMTNIEFTKLYEPLYTRPISEVRFQGYIYQNLTLTENNLAYIKLTEEKMKEFSVDSAAAGNMINDLKFVQEILIWVFFSEDKKNKIIKANIRSRGPVINEVAANYGGGGHKYASGARLTDWGLTDDLIKDLDKVAYEYNKKNKE